MTNTKIRPRFYNKKKTIGKGKRERETGGGRGGDTRRKKEKKGSFQIAKFTQTLEQLRKLFHSYVD